MSENARPTATDPFRADGVPGYPADLEKRWVLADGRHICIRPIRPDDVGDLRAAIAHADPGTLHARFLGSPPQDAASIHRLVEVDYVNRLALVAFAPDGTGVGIARYEGLADSTSAEVAVAVDPAWRKVGLASRLLRELGLAALDRGITEFTAMLLAENRPIVGVLANSKLPFTVEIQDAVSTVVLHLIDPARYPGPT
jgi:GNAT superfamily N-acetyltransferase